MKVFRIRITREDVRDVYRVFEFSARHTLYDIHRAIQQAFELDDDHLHAFFMSGRHWDASSEVDAHRTARTRLYELALKAGQRFAYVFDFGDELWHELQVEDVVEMEMPPNEPRQVESVGAAPAQYAEHSRGPRLDASALVPLAAELIALFPFSDGEDDDEPFGGDEPFADDDAADDDAADDDAADDDAADDDAADDDELDENGDLIDDDEPDHFTALDLEPLALESAHAIALRLAGELDGNAELFFALEETVGCDLASMLADLPMALAHAERVDEGADLASMLAFIDAPHFLGERGIILAEAGRRDEALAQVTRNLESQTGDSWAQVKAAEVYGLLDEPIRAEALLRSALEETDDDDVRDGALDRLLALLSSQDRNGELAALLAAERARLDVIVNRRLLDAAPPATVQRTTAKVGRNDPCPCGSGKKYKKCCAD